MEIQDNPRVSKTETRNQRKFFELLAMKNLHAHHHANMPHHRRHLQTFSRLPLLRPPATPISAKNEQNSNFSVKHHQDKTCSWHCPFCSFKTIESNSTRRSHEIRDHLGRCHPFEFKKAQQESSESQASNQLRRGLGIMKQIKPLEFVKIKKEDAGFSCPYCRLGTVHMPSNSTLRRKT